MIMNFKNFTDKKVLGIRLYVLLIALAVLIIVGLIIRAKIKKRKRMISECVKRKGKWDAEKKKCVVKPPSNSNGDDGVNDAGEIIWSPSTLASEIERNIEGYNFMVYPETADKILALNDPQLKSLYSYYNENNAVDYPTLTQLFENEWDDTLFGKSKYDMVVDRLRALKLY